MVMGKDTAKVKGKGSRKAVRRQLIVCGMTAAVRMKLLTVASSPRIKFVVFKAW